MDIAGLDIDRLEMDGLEVDGLELDGLEIAHGAIIVSNPRMKLLMFYTTQT